MGRLCGALQFTGLPVDGNCSEFHGNFPAFSQRIEGKAAPFLLADFTDSISMISNEIVEFAEERSSIFLRLLLSSFGRQKKSSSIAHIYSFLIFGCEVGLVRNPGEPLYGA